MIFIIIVLVLIIMVCSYLIFRLKMNNKVDKTREKFSVIKKEEVPTLSEIGNTENSNVNVEVLDLNDKSKNNIDKEADALDLDDLFKTMSLSKVEEEKEFDFDLKRSDENKTA